MTIAQTKTPITPASWDLTSDPMPTPITASSAPATRWPAPNLARVPSLMARW